MSTDDISTPLVRGTMKATPFGETDNLKADFERHLKSVIRLFNSPTGSIIRELVAEAQSDPHISARFQDRFWQPRRDLSRARLQRGIDRGRIRADIDPEIVLDAIYGPLWTRLMVRHLPMRPSDAAHIVDAIWPGIADHRLRDA